MKLFSGIRKVQFGFIFMNVFVLFSQSNPKFKVTLDAGHGGKDYGAIYNGHIEKM